MSDIDICDDCGQTRDQHHDFKPIKVPAGCICPPFDWGNPRSIPAICEAYMGDGSEYCSRCEHEEKCHKVSRRVTG